MVDSRTTEAVYTFLAALFSLHRKGLSDEHVVYAGLLFSFFARCALEELHRSVFATHTHRHTQTHTYTYINKQMSWCIYHLLVQMRLRHSFYSSLLKLGNK